MNSFVDETHGHGKSPNPPARRLRLGAVPLPVAFALLLFCVGCSTVPYSGRSRMLLVSEAEERQMGEEAWREVLAKETPSDNAFQVAAVRRVGRNIADSIKEGKNYQWEFKVFKSDTANAFCLPGGKVAVYSGLFQFVHNDAELATVMAHEIAHAIARHGAERVSEGTLSQLGQATLGIVLNQSGVENTEQFLQLYGAGSQLAVMLPYSRAHEYEADQIGLTIMAKAGYDPEAALDFWKEFSKLSNYGAFKEFFATHPMGEKRIAAIKALLPEAMTIYQKAPVKHGYGERYPRISQ